MKSKNDLSHINSLDDLLDEQRRLRMRIRFQENQLRESLQQIPGELVYTGVNSIVPAFLSGKLVTSLLNLVRNLIHRAFSNDESKYKNRAIFRSLKSVGLFSVLRLAYKFFIKRKGL
ncbi:MAG: hypothetical protein H7Y27_10335 [Gemmatimonadaceae bacterium]|nr:hypothetical protein [Chitinophagaceae bacterium]